MLRRVARRGCATIVILTFGLFRFFAGGCSTDLEGARSATPTLFVTKVLDPHFFTLGCFVP